MPTSDPLPIALVDDHTLVRDTLADVVDTIPGVKVVLRAGNGLEYIAAVEAGMHVSVAVVDLNMPLMNGYETMQWIRSHRPDTRTVALSFESTRTAVLRAVRCGAVGYLRKDVEKAEFIRAVGSVAREGHYREGMVSELIHSVEESAMEPTGRRHVSGAMPLTQRELEFIRLACHEDELTYDRIAAFMKVHRRTVDGYRESVFSKMDVHSKAGLVLKAVRYGLIDHDRPYRL